MIMVLGKLGRTRDFTKNLENIQISSTTKWELVRLVL